MPCIALSIEHGLARLYGRIHRATESSSELALFRIFFGAFLLLFQAPHYSWVATAPRGFFYPPQVSVAALHSDFLPSPFFYAGEYAALVLILCITVGVRARMCGLALVVLHLYLSNFRYSFGKIDHDIMLWLTLLCLSFSNWGTRYALIKDRKKDGKYQRWALTLLAIFICFGMLTAGLNKLPWVDFDVSTGGFLSWFYHAYHNNDHTHLLAPLIFKVPPHWFEVGDYAAVLFETTGFLFLLAGRRYWRAWLLTACMFHLFNALVVNIPFHIHVPVYGVFLLELKPLTGAWLKRPAQALGVATASLLALAHVVMRINGRPAHFLFVADRDASTLVALYVSLLLWVTVIFFGARALSKKQLS